MSLFQISPESVKRSYLPHPGRYGAGAQHGGNAELVNFIVSCREAQVKGPRGLVNDPDCIEDDYSRFVFEVSHPDFGKVALFDHQPHKAFSGSKLLPWLTNLGFSVTPSGEFDPNQVTGKLPLACILEVSGPRQNKQDSTIHYSGNVLGVFGL